MRRSFLLLATLTMSVSASVAACAPDDPESTPDPDPTVAVDPDVGTDPGTDLAFGASSSV